MSSVTGTVLFLQKSHATKLIGSLTCVAEPSDAWIKLVFFPEPGLLSVTSRGGQITGTVSRTVAMQLIANLRVLLAQARLLREGMNREAENSTRVHSGGGDIGRLGVGVDRDVVTFAVEHASESSSVIEYGEQIEWRMSEDIAVRFESMLVEAIAKFATEAFPDPSTRMM